MKYQLRSAVWRYPGEAGWHFVTLSKNVSRDIQTTFGRGERGFGSIPVLVTVGNTQWRTSVFPDTKARGYLLPLKSEVRRKEGITEGSMLSYAIEIVA